MVIQDNAPIHVSRATTQWMHGALRRHLPRLPLPPNSPDLNPLENLWAHVQERLDQGTFTTVAGLWRRLRRIWRQVPTAMLRRLTADMPRRLRRVLAARGGNITLHWRHIPTACQSRFPTPLRVCLFHSTDSRSIRNYQQILIGHSPR